MSNLNKDETKIVSVVSGRNEFQLYMMFLVAIVGLSLLLSSPAPTSVEALYPKWVIYVWAVGLLAGGLTNLFGVLWKWNDLLTSLYVEMASLVQLFLAGLIYSVAGFIVVYNSHSNSYIGIAFISVLAFASAWRFLRLSRWAREIRNLRSLSTEVQSFIIKNASTESPNE